MLSRSLSLLVLLALSVAGLAQTTHAQEPVGVNQSVVATPPAAMGYPGAATYPGATTYPGAEGGGVPPAFHEAPGEGEFPDWGPRYGLQPGVPFQDFSVQPPPRTFPNCRLPLLSWRVGPGPECSPWGENGTLLIPAHAVRLARWYVAADVVGLRRDAREEQSFARLGLLGQGPNRLTSQDFDYPLDAGGQFMLGRRLTERTSFEATYLGSFDWNASAAARDNTSNIVGGGGETGLLMSPFSGFGLPPEQGLDFNTLVSASSQANLESIELMFRYRPDMPYGAYDVSFLYGFRYLHIDDTLTYHSESQLPTPGGAINDYSVAADNDMIGAQFGISQHFLILPTFWIDWDTKGAIYNNHARQRTVYSNTTGGTSTSFANEGGKDDTAFSADVRIIGNFQIRPRLTLRAGYQATFTDSIATGVSNFQNNLDFVRFGPSFIDTKDSVIYHGPVMGIEWVR